MVNLKEGKLQYRDLARLLPITKKMEHHLTKMGGEGRGLWERADSIKMLFPNSDLFMKNVLEVAEVRNNAMHGNPQIDNIDVVLEKATKLSSEIGSIKLRRSIKNIPNLLWSSIMGFFVWVYEWIVRIVVFPFILLYELALYLYELAIALSIVALKLAVVGAVLMLIFKLIKS